MPNEEMLRQACFFAIPQTGLTTNAYNVYVAGSICRLAAM
jgi:hypothetical protein